MNFIFWLLIGLAAGALAKLITPQKERGGWISSLVVGVIGSMVGGFIAGLLPLTSWMNNFLIGELAVATGGAVLVLFIYHKYLADKWNLPI